jgi:hydroxymethylbilane synthase
MSTKPIRIATRGSALALAQAHRVLDQCRALFPRLEFEIAIFKTTGDKLQSASLSQPAPGLPKGLFTKELEVALLTGDADLAVHSLKDLPTGLPDGLCLGAVTRRADVRDVLIIRDAGHNLVTKGQPGLTATMQRAGSGLQQLSTGATVGTSSTRRKAQLLDARPDLRVVEIRGNVLTRLEKLAGASSKLDATLLAAAGLDRLGILTGPDGFLAGANIPEGLLASVLDLEIMLPCVGQGALGIEVRADDSQIAALCRGLDHASTHACVKAERAFLAAVGGGCQSPVAAYGEVIGDQLRLRAVSFVGGTVARGDCRGPVTDAARLGAELAGRLHPDRTGSTLHRAGSS